MQIKLDSLKKLYVLHLKDLFSAENQLFDALPKMLENSSDEGLKKVFRRHLDETKLQIVRLNLIFENLEFSPSGHRCEAMAGLLKEGESFFSSDEIDDSVRDAVLASAAQRCKHYEIAAYGTVHSYAEKLGEYEAADVLEASLNEEYATDRALTKLARRSLNFEAMVS